MDLGIAGIPEGVETASPRCNDTRECQENKASKGYSKDQQDEGTEDGLELLAWQLGADILHEADNLQ